MMGDQPTTVVVEGQIYVLPWRPRLWREGGTAVPAPPEPAARTPVCSGGAVLRPLGEGLTETQKTVRLAAAQMAEPGQPLAPRKVAVVAGLAISTTTNAIAELRRRGLWPYPKVRLGRPVKRRAG